jgi:YebC/PmpR family DNA-binding regulatory protein
VEFWKRKINMAGHSHWAGIKHKKGKVDKQKSKIFSKISKEITVAAKLGSRDAEMNSRLRSAIQSARSANMPKDNIERAIDKSEINQDTNFESLRYEGFGPEKIAVIVETLTDNKNRTASNIRTIFQKHRGNLGTLGSASHNFNQYGIIRINKKEISNEEILELAINSGANECISSENFHQVICDKEELYKVKKIIEQKVSNFIFTGIEWIPLNKINIMKDNQESILNFLEALNDDDDVQNVFTNMKEINIKQ